MRDTPPRVLSCYFTTEVSPTTPIPDFPPSSTQLPPSSIHLYFIYILLNRDDTLAIMIITLRHLLTILSHLFLSLLPYINAPLQITQVQQQWHYWRTCQWRSFITSSSSATPTLLVSFQLFQSHGSLYFRYLLFSILHPPPSTLHPYHLYRPLFSSTTLYVLMNYIAG